MSIKGFQGTSLLDFPGRIASIVFFGGCNLTCPFCHNPSLVLEPEVFPTIPLQELLEELEGRRSFIDGVVVSGGEPTISPDFLPLLEGVKSLGLAAKLDTNGFAPRILRQILDGKMVDYIALDVKTSPERYGELHRGPVDISLLEESIAIVLSSPVEYEFRTTCVPGYVAHDDIRRMGETLRGGGLWTLQQFVPEHSLDESLQEMPAFRAEEIRAFAELAMDYVANVRVRGI